MQGYVPYYRDGRAFRQNAYRTAGYVGGAALTGAVVPYIGKKVGRWMGKKNGSAKNTRQPVTKNNAKRVRKIPTTNAGETKYYYTTSSTSATGPTEIGLFSCQQGLTKNDRIGDRVNMIGFKIRFRQDINDAVACAHRVMILIPRDSASGTSDVPTSDLEPVNTDLWQVVKDKTIRKEVFSTGDSTTPSCAHPNMVHEIWIPYKYEIRFDGNTATPETVIPRLYVYRTFESLGTGATASEFSYSIKAYYKDP